ncbi:MAG: ubiquinol-cytochrome c reductase iron-sulfur subunit [Thermoanaerobaculia bacterium]|nr:ubiquinol-cytochrome c reductase iron-sulfur subunit [Thermoanaerobaculia bacterium]
MREAEDEPVPRRRFLEIFGATVGSAVVMGLSGLMGCSRESGGGDGKSPGSGAVRVPLDRIPPGERLEVEIAGVPVELSRTEEEITARSLRCTHFGCTVAWKPDRGEYVCPCHDGAFEPDGTVAYGPPDDPLPTLRTEREGDSVKVWPLERKGSGSSGEGDDRT